LTALAGLWSFGGAQDARLTCDRMLAAQTLYGPHHGASWTRGDVAMGRRLFRLLPQDVHDNQPLVGEDDMVLVADLRLDNREDLEATLGLAAQGASRRCDAAVLLAAWRRWREDCFDHLVGDYAFALWDGGGPRLILARDPFGQRPLHYHLGDDFCAFASMPKGLHALSDIPRGPDEEVVARFVALMPRRGSGSFHRGIRRVEPGCFVIITPDDVVARRHWRPARRTLDLATADDYALALRGHLDQAVRARLRGGEAGVGAHLSAGWDSGAVAATAARLLAPSGGQVTAFTAAPRMDYAGPTPRGRLADEGPLATATAALYANMAHVVVRSSGGGGFETLRRAAFLYDQPILNPCNLVWFSEINGAARDRAITVMLTGAFGNAGLTDSGVDWIAELAAQGRWRRWWVEARAVTRAGTMSWRGVIANSFGAWVPGPVWTGLRRLRGGPGKVTDHTAIHPARLAAIDPADHDIHRRPRADVFATRLAMLGVDPGNFNKGVLGGWGVDLRDPTADRRLVEFCLATPRDQVLRNGEARALARRALADRLPPEVLSARDKGYQAADWHEVLTVDRDQITLEVERLARCGPAARILDLDKLRRLVEAWPSGGWERGAVIDSYRGALLRGLAVGHFLRMASGAN
jgi:asparagine synthase (glutamine-hydrolysing)